MEKIFIPQKLKNAIYQLKNVLECAVIGIPDEKWGEAVHAIIRLKENTSIDEKEVIEHCHKNIAGFKCPKSVSFREAPMPVSGAGKVLKTELRKPFWKDTDTWRKEPDFWRKGIMKKLPVLASLSIVMFTGIILTLMLK